ncbi:MAG: hypothetical protein JO273_07530, partial [Methylobacteriaceae bacterium]|nr:hypothetical protein [Methylobacteriaceae bacterium]
KNKIMPEPCQFLNPKLPLCSIIRPTDAKDAAKRALAAFTHDGLFIGQTNNEFFEFMQHLADAADAARRRV